MHTLVIYMKRTAASFKFAECCSFLFVWCCYSGKEKDRACIKREAIS